MKTVTTVVLALGVLLAVVLHSPRAVPAAAPMQFTLMTVDIDGTKAWLPSSIMAHQGEVVELTLRNPLDVPHGFALPALGIEEVIEPHAMVTITFTAALEGAYPYSCQLHPPHVGGTLVVVRKEAQD